MHEPTPEQARAALDTVERSRRRMIDEIDVPAWYWAGVGGGWIVLGVIAELNNPWFTSLATLAFGAAHSWVAPRVVDGRHRSRRASVHPDLVGRWLARAVLGGLVALVGLTVAVALALNADGTRHPAIAASVLAAVTVVLGGPLLLATVRRRATSTGTPG